MLETGSKLTPAVQFPNGPTSQLRQSIHPGGVAEVMTRLLDRHTGERGQYVSNHPGWALLS
jgi:hypothetical protein